MRLQKNAVLSGAVLAASGAGFWMACAAPRGAQAQRYSGEEIARRNEKDYHYKGEIKGRVLLDNGKPAVGFTVRAWFAQHQTGAPGEGFAVTDASGNYRIHGLNPQGFFVAVESGSKPYIPPPYRTIQLITYPNKTTANVNFTLRLGPKITIRVRDAESGTPISGIVVSAFPYLGTNGSAIGETNAQGNFAFRASSLTMQLRLDADKQQSLKIAPAPGYAFSKGLQLAAIIDTEWVVKVYKNSTSYVPATFRGVVLDARGTPVSGAVVRLTRYGGISSPPSVRTDGTGRFAIATYRIGFTERGTVLQAEKGGLDTMRLLTAEQTWKPIVLRLHPPLKTGVAAQVTDPQGNPLSGVPVECNEVFLDPKTLSFVTAIRKDGGVTDTNGQWSMGNLSSEAYYQFEFGGNNQFGRGRAWGETKFPDVPYTNGQLRLQDGKVRNIGRVVVYPADATVAGRVINSKPPKPNLYVVVQGKHAYVSMAPDAGGNFSLSHLVREPLTVGVYSSPNGNGWRTGPGSPDEVYKGTVRAGDTNVKIVLPAKKQP